MSDQKSNFLFIVFRDPTAVGMLDFFYQALGGVGHLSPHITIQGPFPGRVTRKQISEAEKSLRGDTMLIANPGYFENNGRVVFFYRVSSEHLKRTWNKPDYPIQSYGFNPHVTVYEGTELERVKRAIQFLKREPIEFLCRDFDVVPYVSKQTELFPLEETLPDDSAIQKLAWKGKIGSSFRTRFMAAINMDRIII
jgi:hypothetical protein